MDPRVSVLLPYRDAEATLEEALDSVLSQRGVELQVLCVDDGSRDGGAALVASLAARHRALRPLRTGGSGIAAALNLAEAAADAPLLARMDADDRCRPGRLLAQAQRLQSDAPLAALGGRVQGFPEAEVAGGMQRYLSWQNGLITPEDHRNQLFVEAPLCHPSVMLKRTALRAVGGYRCGDFPEDYDLWLRLDAAGHCLAKLPETLLEWRLHGASATFRDPRYQRARFLQLKAPHLAARLAQHPRPLNIWGAGKTGKRMARALEAHGLHAERFIDIDPRKLGRQARGAPIVGPTQLATPGHTWVVVAVGAAGARDQVREYLNQHGFREGPDYLCAS